MSLRGRYDATSDCFPKQVVGTRVTTASNVLAFSGATLLDRESGWVDTSFQNRPILRFVRHDRRRGELIIAGVRGSKETEPHRPVQWRLQG